MRQPEFDCMPRKVRKPPRVMAKLEDAGGECVQMCSYRCRKCGWSSGWIEDDRNDTEIRRGFPCEVCNRPSDT